MKGRLVPALAGVTLFCFVSVSPVAWGFGVPIDPHHSGGNGWGDPCTAHLAGCVETAGVTAGALGWILGGAFILTGIATADPLFIGMGVGIATIGAGSAGTVVAVSQPGNSTPGSNAGRFAHTTPPYLMRLDPSASGGGQAR